MLDNKVFQEIIDKFQQFEEVQAIGIGGSTSANTSDKSSDIDVYVFVNRDIPVEKRREVIIQYSTKYEVGCEYFGAGDEFVVDKIDRQLDVMYFNTQWFEEIVNNVWEKHFPSNGYTTSFLFTLNVMNIIFDKNDWLLGLQNKLKTPYPAELKNNIIKRNLMLLKDKPFASYSEQIEKAVKRYDLASVNHRTAAFMASYFDILFAKNELLHPGEKRLISYAFANCKILPENFENDVNKMLTCSLSEKTAIAEKLVENLRVIL